MGLKYDIAAIKREEAQQSDSLPPNTFHTTDFGPIYPSSNPQILPRIGTKGVGIAHAYRGRIAYDVGGTVDAFYTFEALVLVIPDPGTEGQFTPITEDDLLIAEDHYEGVDGGQTVPGFGDRAMGWWGHPDTGVVCKGVGRVVGVWRMVGVAVVV
ncbi:hypothetical protein BJY04DRAFT_216339 [Aspergillus karnatakaensis]|uniref:uncharacterized protein n=1 Tax=Aspergillus karnatakaensis TaxID=1810916 RepID=UPI003CCCDC7D